MGPHPITKPVFNAKSETGVIYPWGAAIGREEGLCWKCLGDKITGAGHTSVQGPAGGAGLKFREFWIPKTQKIPKQTVRPDWRF